MQEREPEDPRNIEDRRDQDTFSESYLLMKTCEKTQKQNKEERKATEKDIKETYF